MASSLSHNQLLLRHRNFQDLDSPDINLERDIIPEISEVGLLGYENEYNTTLSIPGFRINFFTIIISALIFLVILAWFDFIQSAFYSVLFSDSDYEFDLIPPNYKFLYALLITGLVLLIILLIYYYHHKIL